MLSNAVVVKVYSFYLSIVVEISEYEGDKEQQQQQCVYVRTCDQTPVGLAEGTSKRQHWKRCFDSGLAKDGAWHHLSFPPWFNRARRHLPIHPQKNPDCLYN